MEKRSFTQNMLRLGSGMGLSQAFSRFMDTAVALNSDNDDPMYLRNILIDYSKEERYLFMETYYSLMIEMTGDGLGLKDVLGEFYIRNFHSPARIENQNYYDMLPGLLSCSEPATRVTDYDCNTGRRFLAAAKFNRNLRFYGMDTFYPFVRISLLNLCMNGLYGEIGFARTMNSSIVSVSSVDLNYKGKPVIRNLFLEDSLLYQKTEGRFPVAKRLIFNF